MVILSKFLLIVLLLWVDWIRECLRSWCPLQSDRNCYKHYIQGYIDFFSYFSHVCCKSVEYIECSGVCDRPAIAADDGVDANAQQVQSAYVSGRCYALLLPARRRMHLRALRGGTREVPDILLITKASPR